MSNRAKLAAAVVSTGVIALGWQIGTAGGQTLGATQGQSADRTPTPTPTPIKETVSSTQLAGSGMGQLPSQSTQLPGGAAAQTCSAAWQDGTFTGSTVRHRYGAVQVTVVVAGGKISDVTAKVASDGDRKSDMINSQAIPMMKSQVLAANCADVSTVGGATYTTSAYLTSLQAALDQAR